MGCFGSMEATKEVNTSQKQTTSPPKWVEDAGKGNYELARSILDKGFVPYTGTRVAPLSDNERTAGDLIAATAGSGNPYSGTAASRYNTYGTTPAFQYDYSTVVNDNGPLGTVQSYMDPYLAQVLAPQLREIDIAGAKARQGINANATSAGAFGDARHGVVESEQRKNEAQLVGDTTGKAFSDAFNTAMGLRTSDLQRLFGTQQAQQSADETALNRMRQSGIDLTGLDQYDTNRAINLSDSLGKTGATARSVEQGRLDADYEQFLRQQGWTNNEIAFLTTLLAGTPTTKTTNNEGQSIKSEPNNSGWQAVGSIATSLLSMI